MIIKNVGLKGSQCLAKERMIRAKKLRKGPGMTGIIQPASPISAKTRPRTINAIVTMPPLVVHSRGKTCSRHLPTKVCANIQLPSRNVDNIIKTLGPEDRVLTVPPKRGLRRSWVFSQGHISSKVPLGFAAVQYLEFMPMNLLNPPESPASFTNSKYWTASY